MTTKPVLLAFMFLTGACGGSDPEPKSATTTQATAPDEKSEESIQMSAAKGAPAKSAKPASDAKPAAAGEAEKPAAGEAAKPAAGEAAKPAPPPK